MAITRWPTVERLVTRLFTSRWQDLEDSIKLKGGRYPGVYLLAYEGQQLRGARVRPQKVFYVGMTHAGLSRRLKQFMKGIESGEHHSGGKRFFIEVTRRKGYSRLRAKKRFFFAAIPVLCKYKKHDRDAEDLRRMGLVTALEYFVLAHILEKCGKEPELNKH